MKCERCYRWGHSIRTCRYTTTKYGRPIGRNEIVDRSIDRSKEKIIAPGQISEKPKALIITGLNNPGQFGKAKSDLESKGYEVEVIRWKDKTPIGYERPVIVIGHSMGGATAVNRFGGMEGVKVHNLNGAVISSYENVTNYVNTADPTSIQAFLTQPAQFLIDVLTGGKVKVGSADTVHYTRIDDVDAMHDKNYTYDNYVRDRIPEV